MFSGRYGHPMVPLSDHPRNDLSSFRGEEGVYGSRGKISINHDASSQDQIIPSKQGVEA